MVLLDAPSLLLAVSTLDSLAAALISYSFDYLIKENKSEI
jgi:hypothetical protein